MRVSGARVSSFSMERDLSVLFIDLPVDLDRASRCKFGGRNRVVMVLMEFNSLAVLYGIGKGYLERDVVLVAPFGLGQGEVVSERDLAVLSIS